MANPVKTILITGAAGGLGSALALVCANAGDRLILLDKDRRGLGELSDMITGMGRDSPGLYPLDLAGSGIDEFNDLVAVIGSEYGSLDALVHCAVDFDGLQPLDQVNPQDWLRSMQVNVNAPWLLSCSCLPLLKQSGQGRLVFMLDELGTVTDAYWGAYGAAKSALTGLARQFAAALEGGSVTVLGVVPGPMRTAFRARVFQAEDPLQQPDPAVVAEKLAALLHGEPTATGPIVDLSR